MDGVKRKGMSAATSATLSVVMFLIGLALVFYPTVADRVNNYANKDAIGEYQRELLTLDVSEYQRMLDEARQYNADLFRRTPYIGELTAEGRKAYESLLDVTGTGIIGYIEIDSPRIYLAIYHGTTEEVLRTGAGHLDASSLPVDGESVHSVITGHSGLPSARLFTDLDLLKVGDTFRLHVLNETYYYKIEDIRRALPDELENMRIEKGEELCTLLTCTPYGVNTHRLVLTGRRFDPPPGSIVDDNNDNGIFEEAMSSTWNRWFVFLPFAVYASITLAVIIIRRNIKRRRRH